MLTKQKFMEKVHVTKEEYVDGWVRKNLIPGVIRSETGRLLFPNFAKRPYRARCGKGADLATLCTGIVNACLKNKHVCKETYGMTGAEFENLIGILIAAGLIFACRKDGIVYYEAALKLSSYKKAKYHEIKKCVVSCLSAKRSEKRAPAFALRPSAA